MQKFNACKKRDWLIHFLFSTSSVCMIAIWPVGPPKLINPSFNQNRNASPKRGCLIAVVSAFKLVAVEDSLHSEVGLHSQQSKYEPTGQRSEHPDI
jgi:hypothetical protein